MVGRGGVRCGTAGRGRAVGALQGALCSCMEGFVESGCGFAGYGLAAGVRRCKAGVGRVWQVGIWFGAVCPGAEWQLRLCTYG